MLKVRAVVINTNQLIHPRLQVVPPANELLQANLRKARAMLEKEMESKNLVMLTN